MNRLLTLCHGWDALDAESKKIIDTVMGCKDKFFDAPARLLESMKASASFLRTKQQYFIQGKGWKDVYPGAVIAKALMSNSDTSKFLMLENDDARKAKLTIVVNWINDQEATDPEFNVARDWLALPVNTQGNIIKAKLDFNYLATDPIDTKNERPGIVEAANALANIQ